MSLSCSSGRWTVWRSQPGQGSTDALANWAAKARAKVEWETTLIRQTDNTHLHVVVPKLTCVKCHPYTDAYGAVTYPCSDSSQARLLCEKVVADWRNQYYGYYELIDHLPRIGGYGAPYSLSILICYQLKQTLIQDCVGEGPNLKAAKSMAAQKLLASGHCMVCL
ncbi:dsrm domain protein, putative, partial [Rhizoctonia solani AG-3 Rhs1AP]